MATSTSGMIESGNQDETGIEIGIESGIELEFGKIFETSLRQFAIQSNYVVYLTLDDIKVITLKKNNTNVLVNGVSKNPILSY